MQKLPLVFILSAVIDPSWACTAAVVPFDNFTSHGLVIARSMEYGWPASSLFFGDPEKIYFHRKGDTYPFADTRRDAKYGMVCITAVYGAPPLGVESTMDGINEEGLTVTANLHHQAEYQTKTSPKTDSPNDIGHHQVAKHLLAQYKTVKEVIDYLKGVSVYHGFKPLPGFHWLVADSNGNAVTIEYIDGELKVYGNKDVGVLTNDPSFDWQLGYVDQFAGYSVKTTPEAPTKQSCGQFSKSISTAGGDDFTTCNAYTDDPETEQNVVVNAPKVASNGMSTRLLPGSYTPADRFVRTFLIKESVMQNAEDDGSLKPTTLDEALVVGTGLLNNVHIVRGSVGRERSLIPPPWEYTAWAALKVPKYKTKTGVVFKQEHGPYFYYRTYNNMQWNKIDLSQLKDFFTTGAAKIDPIPFPNIDDCRSGDGNKDPKWGCFDAGVKDTTPQWQCCSPGETANGSRTLLFAPGGGCHRC